ncbi:MAG: glucose-6-phosphate isomerase, partial [Desulfomicrobium sp.]|nr:glucose-6-phosphate isomerase [Desulfomicrobium sp.]
MIDQSSPWRALGGHVAEVAPMRELFDRDPGRFERFSTQGAGLFLDYSKNRVTDKTMGLLFELAREADVAGRTEAMFSGGRINSTENRAVLHVALRADAGESILVDGVNVVGQVHAVLGQMEGFTARVRSGEWKGFTGERITDVVNIGIGGSDLGPRMVTAALDFYRQPDLNFHFV